MDWPINQVLSIIRSGRDLVILVAGAGRFGNVYTYCCVTSPPNVRDLDA